MSSSIYLRRFSQLSLDRATQPATVPRSLLAAKQASYFSTSTARQANPTAKKGMGAAPKRGTKTLNVKKGRKDPVKDLGKKPSPGDRKAMRKRVVLSNNNALEVPGLKDLEKDNALNASNEGSVMGLPENVVDALRAIEAFKPSQGWSLFRRPATLMRKETIQLAQLLKDAEGTPEGEAKKTLRRILTGQRMSGKSTLLLQGLAMGVLRDWVVIHLPEGQDLVNAHTEYAPLPGSQPTQYTQDMYTAKLLSQVAKANEKVLASINVATKPALPFPLPANSNLKQLAELGIVNPEASWPVFAALWKELTQPGRPPIMLGLDGLSHVMGDSQYMSAEVKPIHAFDLTIVRHFIDCLSGKASLPNGGLVLAATSKSNSPTSPALDFSVQVAEARQNKTADLPQWNPYNSVDQRAIEALKDIEVLQVGGMSKEEARSIMEYYAASGMLRAKVDEGFVTEKWSLAGMGNIGELERASVRLRV